MKVKYATQQSYDPLKTASQVDYASFGSETQEDLSLSVKTILSRFTRGLPVEAHVYSSYDSDFDEDDDLSYIDLGRLDLAELDALRSECSERIAKFEQSQKHASEDPPKDLPENASDDAPLES